MEIESILFDNDGTLYKLRQDFFDAVIENMLSYVSKKLNISEKKAINERKRLIEKYGVKSTEYVFSKEYRLNRDDFVKDTYLSVNLGDYGIQYNKDLRGILQNIKLPKSILTNNPSEFARKILTTLGIEDLFENIIGSKEMNYKLKPRKEAFLKTAEITGYDLEKTLYVDDIPEFLLAAKKLGISTVLVGAKHNGNIDYQIEKIEDIGKIRGIK